MNLSRSGRRSLTWKKLVKTPRLAPWQLTLSTCSAELLTLTKRSARLNSIRLLQIAGICCTLAFPEPCVSWPLSSCLRPRSLSLEGLCVRICPTRTAPKILRAIYQTKSTCLIYWSPSSQNWQIWNVGSSRFIQPSTTASKIRSFSSMKTQLTMSRSASDTVLIRLICRGQRSSKNWLRLSTLTLVVILKDFSLLR